MSYNDKHNEANGEENRDGANDNNSWNCGAEGPTDDEAILELRERQKRNLLATLLLSQGVPMLLAGDEIWHTQQGQQQHLLPGQRADVAQLGADARQAVDARIHAPADRNSPRRSRPCSGGGSFTARRSSAPP